MSLPGKTSPLPESFRLNTPFSKAKDLLRRKKPLKAQSSAYAEGRRVLILSVSAGTGHVRAAEALENAFRQQPGVGEVRHIDALRFTNKLFRDFYSKLYIQLVQKAPTILGFVYRNSDEPWKTDRMRLMLDRLNTGPLERFIARFKPDITVCTHFLPAEIISYLITKKKLDARLSIVVTDLDVHAMWLCRTFHRYFVALEESKVHLQALGLPANNITVSGIPIDPRFGQHMDRMQLRREAGFDPARPLFLVSAGAMGVSPAAGVLESLSRLEHPVQAVVICGKNAELRAQLEKQTREITSSSDKLKFQVVGYTDEMHRWMQMSDLYIGKPGGLTTAESMASGLPMIIVAPIPGQEERNSDHLLEKGIALKCNEFTTLPYKLDQLLDRPDTMALMRERALAFSRPRAAETIVETLLNQPREEAAQIGPYNTTVLSGP